MKNYENKFFLKIFILTVFFSLFISSCSQIPIELPSNDQKEKYNQYQQELPYTEVEFDLSIPKPINNEIIFELVDDITGIELNPTRYVMDKIDDNHYQLVLPVQVPSLIKYRFYKNNGLPIYETDSGNQIVEYRMAYISAPGEINNLLTNWSDEQYAYGYGRISGQAVNSETKSPIPNALVVVAGIHSYTNSLGNFVIENLPPGKHNLVLMSTDGEYQTFQQEAIVAEGLTTPAFIGMQAAKFVNVSFMVIPPDGTPENAPIRILGNTYQLGNVFGNIYNGTSIAPARAPKLTTLPDGGYTITMSLPSGFDLRYKYSMGDGFWNAELNADKNFVVRKVIVPDKDTIITDVIRSWKSSETQGVEFVVNVPENTPESDKVSIQFNSFGWSPPIQMWQTGDYQWSYRLFGPYHLVSKIDYRICRNDACGTADDASAPVNGYSFDTASPPEQLIVNVAQWKGWNQEIETPSLNAPEIIRRGNNFVAGFSFSDNYNVNTPIYVDSAYKNIVGVNGNSIVIPVKWTLQSFNPVIFSPITGQNPLWKDLVLMIQKAQNQGLQVWLTPAIELSPMAVKQFVQEDLSSNWQQNFSTLYSEFLVFSADLANYMDIEGVILPTDILHLYKFQNYATLSEMLTAITLSNIDDLRIRFPNKIFISLRGSSFNDERFLSVVDGFVITPKLDFVESDFVGENDEATFKNYLENEIFTTYSPFKKQIFIGLNFPSAKGAEHGCIISEEVCYDFDTINHLGGNLVNTSFDIDLLSQLNLYQAAFSAINETEWVNGVISQEYNPQVAIMDFSSSVRGKPSNGLIWYWFPRMLGITN